MAETQKNETTNQEVTFIIIQAINECIKEHVLEDFFREHRDEVIKMADLDYTWERREGLIRAEEFEEGVIQGEQKKLIRQVSKKLQKGKTPQVIAEELEEDFTVIEEICKQIET